ncbi:MULTISPECIES: Gp138 family membrane-puncturing spike protein [unclassified Gilliamella]|uniref:Gp138 family membrane-puncturing spike protein n=1 Tax=unclassified Gilliamella TaxID=2685620 RepID=UPI0018DCE230|nr:MULTISPECIES: Gp138 family membrane-puncturing spike protein [unclassified Gilliamella]MBI0114492.1 baseplate protein [Gilliamella sp. W8123]MBI0118139.1 baseplate protein [Gilliamella sp. W8129]
MTDSLYNAIESQIKRAQSNIYTALPAKVLSFNGHTVSCQVMINRVNANGQEITIPPLVDVPAQFPHAGGFCITVPIKAGDEGLVVFSSRCIDGWYASGSQSKPLDNRINDLSDGFFIVGCNSVPNKIPDFYNDGASMQTDDGSTHIRLTEGTIYIKGNIKHEGDTDQIGNYNQNGSFNQSDGNTNSTGTITAEDVKTNRGVDLNTHVHTDVQSGSGTTGAPE